MRDADVAQRVCRLIIAALRGQLDHTMPYGEWIVLGKQFSNRVKYCDNLHELLPFKVVYTGVKN